MCFECGDYVYDSELLAIARTYREQADASLAVSTNYKAWLPTPHEQQLLKNNPVVRTMDKDSKLGLRGLTNLGNTCYMNSIVQALIHTPLLRDYFLSDIHVCQFQDRPENCLVCEVSLLFVEFFSGSQKPLRLHRLHRLLCFIWKKIPHLHGNKQHDAHEFLIGTLNLLHEHSRNGLVPNIQHCRCSVHQIFTGDLQSDVVCTVCSGVSTKVEPFWDISLDLGSSVGNSPSLLECLQRFTQPEHLGSANKIRCDNCDTNQECTKQLTIKTLPIVICFQLKRFEHTYHTHRKISKLVAFPLELDMSPFMSHKRNDPNVPQPDSDTTDEKYRYLLFAVINHIGTMDQGHYIAYIKQQYQEWFKCNDATITQASLRQVLDSEGYLLFYHKKLLKYE